MTEFERLDPPSGRGALYVARAVRSRWLTPRDVFAWVSDGAEPGAGRPVIYMQDGQNLFDARLVPFGAAWEVDRCVSALVDSGRMPPVIVVGVASTPERLVDYAPEQILDRLPPEARDLVEAAFGGAARSADYGRLLMEDIKPMIDRHFPTRGDPASTFVIGSSMGAVVAAEILARYPERLAGIACLSGHFSLLPLTEESPQSQGFVREVARAVNAFARAGLPTAGAHRIWLDRSELGIDRFYGPAHQAFESALRALDYRRDVDMSCHIYPGVGHDEGAWRSRLGDSLAFLFAGRTEAI